MDIHAYRDSESETKCLLSPNTTTSDNRYRKSVTGSDVRDGESFFAGSERSDRRLLIEDSSDQVRIDLLSVAEGGEVWVRRMELSPLHDSSDEEGPPESERTPLRRKQHGKDFEEMASCPSNLYCVADEEDEHKHELLGLERSNTAKGVLYTTYKAEAKAALVKTGVMTQGEIMAVRSASPTSIYYIPESTFSKRPVIDVKVKNLCYTVNPTSLSWWQKLSTMQLPWEWTDNMEPQQVLNNVTFSVKSGQMLAIMGNSGSGKTTLLDVIACRTEGIGLISGDVYLNNVNRTSTMVRGCSAYVRQDDRLLPHLTVRETLMFVAQLKLPTTFTGEQISKRVDSVILELGLSHVADSKVGGAEDRGVSGGERRRVSIGAQLLLDPSVLFLDEPTSGLDAFTAHHLVETLARLAKNNRAVLLSIHQPRSDIFELFDRVLILSKGEMAYFGQASNMVDYFGRLGHPCPEFTNPCDFYVDLATIDPTSEETERTSSATVRTLVEAYKSQQGDLSISASGSQEKEERDKEQWPVLAMFRNLEHQPGTFRQFWILYRRCTRSIVEDYGYLVTQLIQAAAMSVVVGLVYFNLKTDQSSMRDRFGMMYILGALYPYMVVLDLIGVYHKERSFLYFELEDRLYGVLPYYFAKIFSEIPFHTFYVAVYAIPVYFIAGLNLDLKDFVMVFAILFLLVYCSRTLAMFSASIMPTFQLGCFFAQTFFSMYIMSAGFFINLDNIFNGLKWVSSVSYLKWGFQALCKVQILNLTFTCEDALPGSCIRTGEEALQSYSLDGNSVWEACVIMAASCVIYLALFFVGMRFVPQKPHEV
ncbi:ATP-binding cassette sub-family G member 8-like isoform X1 [Dreissena polymorpha]|uniref:ATP-binding cassette sub-family G member 8-like isoform X1 n=1 Tax=Dreissena polymorpha TaxID=45954 RepID=UPI002264AAA7|nr:ATP-binding cassette sub-family G member 8-like isoform X1 [Dreissena polymorpha]